MSSLRGADPALRGYFQRHGLPDVYEALLCGIFIMCPEDPLKFLEEKIREIMEKGLDGILWDMCIDPSLKLELKRISETYLHIIFGLNDKQLMTEELCGKAWNFHTRNLKNMCFQAWMQYCLLKKEARRDAEQNMALAAVHYNSRIIKVIVQKWSGWVRFHKEQMALAVRKIQWVFNVKLLRIILKAWHAEAQSSAKTKAYFEQLEKEDQEESFDLHHCFSLELIKEKTATSRIVNYEKSNLPERTLLQIFHYTDLIDLARCAQVSRTWMSVTQNSSLWSDIDFSAVKHKIQDKTVVNILQKWRTYVLRLNLRGCSSLHWPSFKSIGECKNLQDINLSECRELNDESMRLISEGCSALLYLNLSYTDITNGTLRVLSRNFPNLQHLSLAYCRKFTDKGLRYLASGKGCHKLIYLDLSGCIQISCDGFRYIASGCNKIQHLIINDMPTLTDRCIQALVEKCQQITSVVFLDSPHLSDTAFKALAECKLVKVRIEGNNRITDLSFKLMSKSCPYIKHIYMADCQKITDVGLKIISSLKYILVLNLADCIRISDAGVKPFLEGSSGAKLRELNLTNCFQVTDVSVVKIAQRCHNLNYLNLRYCENVTDIGIEALGNMLSLISMDISGTNISDMGLGALGNSGRMKELSVSECKKITDIGIQKFCQGVTDLQYFNVSYCPQLTNETAKALALYCHNLTSLNLAGCPKMTDLGIQYLSKVCHYLHFLDISGCICLTDKVLNYLWKGCTQLRILKMLYCRNITKQAVLKYSARLEKQEYSNAEPPSWFGYNKPSTVVKPQKKHTTGPEKAKLWPRNENEEAA
ncbi:F-box and leucine-rich repeat protein 13 [Alligator mississippiensis]|uniref:F-box and leucine-rich repeat protein 13 n=1 Tax=Alligator mississippiensis TaxID=8496 RepID=UPI0007121176|nr:F-box and leucine-rich repeat protein 13 [Alligator mississippiensis]